MPIKTSNKQASSVLIVDVRLFAQPGSAPDIGFGNALVPNRHQAIT